MCVWWHDDDSADLSSTHILLHTRGKLFVVYFNDVCDPSSIRLATSDAERFSEHVLVPNWFIWFAYASQQFSYAQFCSLIWRVLWFLFIKLPTLGTLRVSNDLLIPNWFIWFWYLQCNRSYAQVCSMFRVGFDRAKQVEVDSLRVMDALLHALFLRISWPALVKVGLTHVLSASRSGICKILHLGVVVA